MNTLINLYRPHQHQQKIIDQAKQFNVLNCGRRYGKTTLALNLISEPALYGYPVAYYAPTYNDLSKFWEEFISTFYPIISKKSEQNKELTLETGGTIDFWSLDKPDSSRGRHYKRIVIDEVEKIRKIKYAWEKTILATLLDLNGDAWLLSTPNRLSNPQSYFLDTLCKMEEVSDKWKTFRGTTLDNPYISSEVLEEFKGIYDELSYRQEVLAEDVTAVMRPFMYSFDEEKHVKEVEYDHNKILKLTFDFNVDPMTVLISQSWWDKVPVINHIDEVFIHNSNTMKVCDEILSRYPNSVYMITGDATMRSRSSNSNITNYQIIKNKLKLANNMMKVPSVNPSIKDSRTLSNSLLYQANVSISPKCKETIKDLKYVQTKQDGTIDKTQDKHRSHLLDNVRYHDWTYFKKWVKLNRNSNINLVTLDDRIKELKYLMK